MMLGQLCDGDRVSGIAASELSLLLWLPGVRELWGGLGTERSRGSYQQSCSALDSFRRPQNDWPKIIMLVSDLFRTLAGERSEQTDSLILICTLDPGIEVPQNTQRWLRGTNVCLKSFEL